MLSTPSGAFLQASARAVPPLRQACPRPPLGDGLVRRNTNKKDDDYDTDKDRAMQDKDTYMDTYCV